VPSSFRFRLPNKQITINLAPNIRKEAAVFDCGASAFWAMVWFADSTATSGGELSLDGSIVRCAGLSIAVWRARKYRQPDSAGRECREQRCGGRRRYGMRHLAEVVALLTRPEEFTPAVPARRQERSLPPCRISATCAGRPWPTALEVAAAGSHNVLLIAAGSGKTMLARAGRHPAAAHFPEAIETTKVHSVAGQLGSNTGLLRERPSALRITPFPMPA